MFIVIGDRKFRACLITKKSLKVNARQLDFAGMPGGAPRQGAATSCLVALAARVVSAYLPNA